jgi:hypothetical protein
VLPSKKEEEKEAMRNELVWSYTVMKIENVEEWK